MSQISPPIRIVVVAAIGLLAAWMLFLRPKADEAAPPAPAASTATAPGVKGLTNAVDKAKAAAATQEASDAKVQAATGGSTDSATAQAAPKAGAAETTAQAALDTGRVLTLAPLADKSLKGLPKRMQNAFARRQVVVIGVINGRDKPWAPMPADDEQVMHTLRHVNRYDGNVAVVSTKLGGLSRLNPVIGDLHISQTPSVVVVDRNRTATVVAGYVDKVSIDQAIADARRNSIAFRVKGAYLTSLNETCGHYFMRQDRFDLPWNTKGVKPAFKRLSRLVGTYERRFAALKPSPRWKGLQSQVMRVMHNDKKLVNGLATAVSTNNVAKAEQAITGYDAGAAVTLNNRMARAGVTGCVLDRKS